MPFDDLGQWFPPTAVHPSELHAPLPSGYPYESLIPPYSKKTPGELLVRYYGDRRNTFDWTDRRGVLRKNLEVFSNYPDNVGATIDSRGLVGKWERPNGLPAEPVPVCDADPVLNESRVVVEFKNRDQEGPSKGVHLAHLCGKGADPARLQGAGDIVVDELKGSELEFVIAWPGYQPERFTICTLSENGGPLVRFDLGEQIAIAYATFFRKVEKERLLPRAAGFYNIALHQGCNWRSDSLGVQFMQLRLVRFRNRNGGSWVADVEIV